MAYLEEVSGKIKQRTLLIGDGVDQVHSPLQVAPQMATDMLNLTSAQYPSLSVRDSLTSKGYLNFYPDVGAPEGYYICSLDPFIASNGDVHYAYITYYAEADPATRAFYIKWYVMASGVSVPVFKKSCYIGQSTAPTSPINREYYATGNFSEYNGLVYLSYSRYYGASTFVFISLYTPSTGNVTDVSTIDAATSVQRVNPSCIYLDKFFMGADTLLKYSATGLPTDFDYALNSGSITLSQGGRITSLVPMRDRLLVSTEKSLFLLMGTEFATFQTVLLADTIGIPNPKCVTSLNGIAYFAASDGDIYEYDGNNLLNITRAPIDTGSKSGVKGGFLPGELSITSISIKDHILYCRDSDTYVYTFDLVKRRWYIHLYAPTITVSASPFVTQFTDCVIFQNNNVQCFLYLIAQRDGSSTTNPIRERIVTQIYTDDAGVAETDIPFTWQSPAYQLNPTGKQSLKAIHLTYYAPVGTNVGIYVSTTVDADDFIKMTTLINSKQKQNRRTVIPVKNNKMGSWLRIKIQGTGNIIIYNMTMEWRIIDRMR